MPETEDSAKHLAALLILRIDEYLREHEPKKHKAAPIEVLLTRAGFSTQEIADLLGKTQRAVQLVLQSQ